MRLPSGLAGHPLFKAISAVLALGAVSALGLTIAFGAFVWDVSHAEQPRDPRADGIVVLTGGSARVESGLQLLLQRRAERLLISGVDPKVSRGALRRSFEPDRASAFACCIDVDHARDTIGNAAEARRWVIDHGYRSLIVVTSDYHMPRSLAEMAASMPGVRLIPYPVGEGETSAERPVRLLLSEFLKYLAVRMRNIVEPPASSSDLRVARNGAPDQ